jgi:soluble lytic murein transglycosylase-like protein
MFDGIFETQLQIGSMRAMMQMLQSLNQQMESLTAASSSTATNSDANFSKVLAQAQSTAAKTTTPAQSTGTTTFTKSSFDDLIDKAAAKYGVNPILVRGVIQAESNFNPRAVSPVGATGLMQLMPGTARGLGVTNSLDPAQNIDGGVRLLSGLLKRYNGKTELALAAYNAGAGAVDRYGGIPPYQETQTYVKRIMGLVRGDPKWSG